VKSVTVADAQWEHPDIAMPAFELADLTGKTWTLKALEGKTVLITVWSSW
jgi:peroxiredoxin